MNKFKIGDVVSHKASSIRMVVIGLPSLGVSGYTCEWFGYDCEFRNESFIEEALEVWTNQNEWKSQNDQKS